MDSINRQADALEEELRRRRANVEVRAVSAVTVDTVCITTSPGGCVGVSRVAAAHGGAAQPGPVFQIAVPRRHHAHRGGGRLADQGVQLHVRLKPL